MYDICLHRCVWLDCINSPKFGARFISVENSFFFAFQRYYTVCEKWNYFNAKYLNEKRNNFFACWFPYEIVSSQSNNINWTVGGNKYSELIFTFGVHILFANIKQIKKTKLCQYVFQQKLYLPRTACFLTWINRALEYCNWVRSCLQKYTETRENPCTYIIDTKVPPQILTSRHRAGRFYSCASVAACASATSYIHIFCIFIAARRPPHTRTFMCVYTLTLFSRYLWCYRDRSYSAIFTKHHLLIYFFSDFFLLSLCLIDLKRIKNSSPFINF